MPESWKPYTKTVIATAGGLITVALTIWGPETSVGSVLVSISAALTALSVYWFPNQGAPENPPPTSLH
jgi:hypothetical protein